MVMLKWKTINILKREINEQDKDEIIKIIKNLL